MSVFRFLETVGFFGTRRSGGKKRRAPAPRSSKRSVGRYLLHELIGKGAMGEVWRAADPHIDRYVAVKLLNIPHGANKGERAEWEQRFVREARAAGALTHPGIVTIHDVAVTEDGSPFIVMELVEGSSLDKILQDGPVDVRIALVWGAQIAEGLAAAHREGVVHRDIKPANVLIDTEGRARIADFGIARLSQSDLTQDGLFLGSPAFASPEQIKGVAVDGRSDLFSLGTVLYAMLTGFRPFSGKDLSTLAYAIAHLEPPSPRRLVPDLSPLAEAVVMKALEKDPDRRYQAAHEMAEDLRNLANGLPLTHAVDPANLEEATAVSSAPAAVAPRAGLRRNTAAQPGSSIGIVMVMAVAVGLGCVVAAGVLQSRPAAATSSASIAPATPDSWAMEQASARVDVRITHSLEDGIVTIWSGKRRLLHADLSSGQAGSWLLRMPQGVHPMRVMVSSAERGLELEEEFTRSLGEAQSARLNVRVKELPRPKLDIMWTDDK